MAFRIGVFAFCKKGDLFDYDALRYCKLLKPYTHITLDYLKTPAGTFANKNELMDAEAKVVLQKLPDNTNVIALSEDGRHIQNSPAFAEWISAYRQQSIPMIFLIGGAYGHSQIVKHRAKELISLSHLTMAHMLARLVLLEQIYRAFTILQKHPYHK